MALILCPDCDHPISDHASTCLYCGCPVERTQDDRPDYALVLLRTDANDPDMIPKLQKTTGLPEETCEKLYLNLPLVLARGLSFGACVALTKTFSAKTLLKIIHDADVDDPLNATAVPFTPVTMAALPKPLTFWRLVGAILMALLIWNTALLFLSPFLSRLILW